MAREYRTKRLFRALVYNVKPNTMFVRNFIIAISFFSITLICCNGIEREKFNKERWLEYSEVDGPDRDLMAEDLLRTHKLMKLSNRQLFQLLGQPANDTTSTHYMLKIKYDMIDPVYSKYLVINFNKDSIITSAKIEEWHKGDK